MTGTRQQAQRSTVKWVLAAAGAVLVHFLASVALVFELVGNAYSFAASIPGGGEVSSKDELIKLGSSPAFGIFSIAGVGILGFIVTLTLLASPATRRWAWVAPLASIAVGVLVVEFATAALQPPLPDVGG